MDEILEDVETEEISIVDTVEEMRDVSITMKAGQLASMGLQHVQITELLLKIFQPGLAGKI